MIQVEALTKLFGPTRAVDGIDFHVAAGEVVGFLGPNGAGKSTTIRMLTCYLPPTRGRATVGGFDIFSQSMEVRSQIGYLPETVPLYPEMRVQEFLRFRGALKGLDRRTLKTRVPEVMELCGVDDVRRKLVAHISRGYRQRVALADALVAKPPIVILDEPTSGLDPNQRRKVQDLVKDLATEHTILFSSHILPEVEDVCTRVIIIHQGRIVGQGTREGLINQLGGGRRLSVEADASPNEVITLLGQLEGCGKPGLKEQDGDFCRVESSLEGDGDPRTQVFAWARDKGFRLRELALVKPSLEEIFARLTTTDHWAGMVAEDIPLPTAAGEGGEE